MEGRISFDELGSLVVTVGASSFDDSYFAFFNNLFGIEHCTVFAFSGSLQPNALLESAGPASAHGNSYLAQEYISGAFAHDPNIQHPVHGRDPLIFRQSSDELDDPDYRRRFYEVPGLLYELVMLGRVNDTLFYSSFYRSDRCLTFKEDDVTTVRSMSKFIVNVLLRHFQLRNGKATANYFAASKSPIQYASLVEERQQSLRHLRDFLLCQEQGLTPREAEVCAGIVHGYSALAISLNLGISVNTVATHRKRAYRKLGVCSQNDLFMRYCDTVASYRSRLSA